MKYTVIGNYSVYVAREVEADTPDEAEAIVWGHQNDDADEIGYFPNAAVFYHGRITKDGAELQSVREVVPSELVDANALY